jgi:hypothetical protein
VRKTVESFRKKEILKEKQVAEDQTKEQRRWYGGKELHHPHPFEGLISLGK